MAHEVHDRKLRVQLLGPVRVWRDGVEVDLGAPLRRAVFAILCINAGRVVTHAELVDALWGETPPSNTDRKLHTYVWGLRRALEPGRRRWSSGQVVKSAGSGYSLDVAGDVVDVTRFGALREAAEVRLGRHCFEGALNLLDEALALWSGPPLDDVNVPFAEQHRIQLIELRSAAAERRAEVLLSLGRTADAIAELTELIAEFPVRESLRGLMMTALYRAGRAPEALSLFRETNEMLVDGLGIEPSAALRQIHDQILAGDPVLRGQPSTSDTLASPLLVGRDDELDLICERVRDVAAGQGQVLWLEGEWGAGKSVLLRQALRDPGFPVHWGSGDELSRHLPLGHVLDCLEVDVPVPAQPATAGPERESDPLLGAMEQVLGLVDQLCSAGPAAIVLDDLQWADEATLLVLHRLVGAIGQLPLLLVGVCRTAPRPPELDRIRDLIDATGGAVIQLEPLDNAAAGQLVEAALGAKPDAAAQSLFERAGGNPLFLREMVAALRHCGLTHVSAGVAGVDDAAWSVMPATVVAAVGRSLGQLPDEVGELLRRAAVLGVEFDLTELAITTGKSARALVLAVEQAVSLGLLRQADRGFAFRHPLVRYSLYEAMPVAVRDLLHRQAAEALERGGAPAERVACHVLATSRAADGWAAKWAIANINVVAGRSPETVANLIGRVITSAGFPKLGNEASTVSGALLPAHSN